MELGWVLILAGIVILAFLHFSGRSRNNDSMGQNVSQSVLNTGDSPADFTATDPYTAPMSDADAAAGSVSADNTAAYPTHPGVQHDHMNPSSGYDPHTAGYPADYVNDPLMTPEPQPATNTAQPGGVPGHAAPGNDTMGFDMDPGDMQRPADAPMQTQDMSGQLPQGQIPPSADASQVQLQAPSQAPGQLQQSQADYQQGSGQNSGFSTFLANLSGGLIGKRRGNQSNGSSAGDGQLYPSNGAEPMVITLHVVAPDGQIIHGPRLQALFEQRGYHYGEMNIFHSLNQGNIVFSVAKMVEPGTFDINNPSSFETPGITLILQLPAPVAANVAFDVLVNEASEMATALGCNLLDSGYSTLSRQTIQHLQDSVSQFMHRQRVAESVPS